MPALYIADGHHRAASAARARAELRQRGDAGEADTFVAVAFPDNQAQILPYNRDRQGSGGTDAGRCFSTRCGSGCRFVTGRRRREEKARSRCIWPDAGTRSTCRGCAPADASRASSLDVALLQRHVLEPLLKIGDVRTDKRIDFVGGGRGTEALEHAVDSRPCGGRVLDAPGDDRRPHVDCRRRRDHAAQVHLVRAEAEGRPARAPDLSADAVIDRMKVLVADKFETSGLEGLRAAGCDVVYEPDLKDDALLEAIRDEAADVLVVRGTNVTAAMLDAGRLGLVVRAGAGYNTIDVAAASTRGIYVSNCPGKNAIAVAELAFGLLLALDRRIPDNVADLRAGVWNKKEYSNAQRPYGRTLGLLGVGNIGREMIRRAAGFGLDVVLWSRRFDGAGPAVERTGSGRAGRRARAARDPNRRLRRRPPTSPSRADMLSVHLALAPDTRNLVNASLLSKLKPGSIVINTARGEVVDCGGARRRGEGRGLRVGLDVYARSRRGGRRVQRSAGQPARRLRHAPHRRVDRIRRRRPSPPKPSASSRPTRRPAACRTWSTWRDARRRRTCSSSAIAIARACSRTCSTICGEGNLNVQETENIVFEGAEAAVARINIDGEPIGRDLRSHPAASGHPRCSGRAALTTADMIR